MVNKSVRELQEEAISKALRAGYKVDRYGIFESEYDILNHFVLVKVPIKTCSNSTFTARIDLHKQEPKKTTGCVSIW